VLEHLDWLDLPVHWAQQAHQVHLVLLEVQDQLDQVELLERQALLGLQVLEGCLD